VIDIRFDRPTAAAADPPRMQWCSDAFVELLRRLELPYVSLTPGASFRGLHDSLVNYLGNERPAILLCLHEEHAVAVAHGYAKVAERPMAVALHSNVGLMHASMALFNAFCDRVPMLVVGATGPIDAARRRPWIDWIHTTPDQGGLVRGHVKWDDAPVSAEASLQSLMRAWTIACSHPPGPTYVCLDSAVQEQPLPEGLAVPDPCRHQPAELSAPPPGGVASAARALAGAQRPLFMLGRVGRTEADWDARVRLAEMLGACVLTDLRVGAAFPTEHPLHPAEPGTFLTESGHELIRAADAILSLDWVDLGGTLRDAHGGAAVPATVVSCGTRDDLFSPPPVDVALDGHPDLLVRSLLDALDADGPAQRADWPPPGLAATAAPDDGVFDVRALATALADALEDRPACLVRLPLGWRGADLRVAHPLDYLGQDGGAGLGSGPGMAVGAALALAGSDRLAVAVLGDGDLLMGATALWTAAHHRLALLVVVANNRSFFNDEVHQERVALQRGRPVENRWVGQWVRDPDPDLAALARSLGLRGHGPIRDAATLAPALSQAVGEALAGEAVLVDVRIRA
jgi:thiamine pyrophosphate-dependent acetolactate synthase large subunit-like protein